MITSHQTLSDPKDEEQIKLILSELDVESEVSCNFIFLNLFIYKCEEGCLKKAPLSNTHSHK